MQGQSGFPGRRGELQSGNAAFTSISQRGDA